MYYKIILNIKLHKEIVNKYLGVKWIEKFNRQICKQFKQIFNVRLMKSKRKHGFLCVS